MLKGVNIHKSYEGLEILKGVDIEIPSKTIATVVGASGAGKSTLLHILGTLDNPDKGDVFLGDKKISSLKGKAMANFRNQELGFIFQFHNLLPEFTALENIQLPALIGNIPLKESKERAEYLLSLLGLQDRMENHPSQLSGGEQQRVSVARALMNEPKIIFADEPSGNLDSKNAEELHELFFKLKDELNQTFVIVTHNNELAKMSDIVFKMKDGLLVTAE
jgi:lipoprotein-releasing system ATP-binding protein